MRAIYWRRVSVGAVVGLLASLIAAILGTIFIGSDIIRLLGGSASLLVAWAIHVLIGTLLGVGYALLAAQEIDGSETAIRGLVYGAAAWVLIVLVLIPVLTGEGARWQAAEAARQTPALIVYLIQGGLLAIACHWLFGLADNRLGILTLPSEEMPEVSIQQHVVILGGGFAGVSTAQHLERLLGDKRDVRITLVSQTNHLLFTPMLAEVTAGGVEAQHISPPLRAFFRRVQVIRGEPAAVNIAENTVTLKSSTHATQTLHYDHLVLALGATPQFFGNKNIETYAFTFKSLSDAIQIRNHVLEMLERADNEPNATRRKALLTFVVVGAGFAGSELIGGLNDFIRGSLWYYHHLRNEEISLILVHPGEHILPELSVELASYAQEKMEARGVTIWGSARVTDAAPSAVMIGDKTVPTETLIWTAGNTPNPIIGTIGCEMDKRGAVITDDKLLAKAQTNVWAVGDCAVIPDVVTGKNAPPTAQYALREAKTLAYNLNAVLHHREPKPFRHRSQGTLAVVGHQTACAEVFGMKFSGLFAWLMWRGIYLGKLPTLEKKVRVLLDWVIDVFFPRDIAYAPTVDGHEMSGVTTTSEEGV